MRHLRLIADDLTGALDAAAQFVTPGRAIPVFMSCRLPQTLPESFAIDGGTREMEDSIAASVSSRYAALFGSGPGVLAFKKVDSLLRGHPGFEIAAMLKGLRPRHCVIAPAFPFHGRVTRGGGLQFALRKGSWQRVGEDLAETLQARGISVQRRRAGDPIPDGVSLWDVEESGDLRRIADAGAGLSGPVLWCGSGGLAAALAGENAPLAAAPLRPLLGLFGSDHLATAAQLHACGGHVMAIQAGAADALSASLSERGVCLARFDIPAGTARGAASKVIARALAELAQRLAPPRGLFISGGETLRALCLSMGTDRLDLVGQLMPGVPVSVMVGGRWDGVRVASKSGAFGDDMLLRRILFPDAQS